MKTLELPREQWPGFCRRLTELNRGAIVTVETQTSPGPSRLLAEGETLRSMVFDDESDACNGLIILETADTGHRPQQHRIIEPIHIRLKNGNNNRYNHIEIIAENGTMVITLNPGLGFVNDYAKTADQATR